MHSLVADVAGAQIRQIAPDPDGPMGAGDPCGLCTRAPDLNRARITSPRRRVGDRWEEVGWDVAIREIGAQLKQIRKQSGVRAIGTWAGAPVALSTHASIRTLAWSVALGSPNLYTPLADRGGAWLRAVELVLGHPIPLQSDVGRAHYVLLLGANQEAQGWGPLQAGRGYASELAWSRKTKGTRVATADPRRTPFAAGADVHLPIRPGTELFVLLGMISAVLHNDWWDRQYLEDYCENREALARALAPWTLERCANACGVGAEALGGVALKFSRAAMAVAHRSPQASATPNATLTGWANLVLHALTANLLRPGGLYENRAILDQHAIAAAIPTAGAPRTRAGDYPLLLLQAPQAVLPDEVLVPGDDGLRALICLHGDPARELPGGERARAALRKLDLLVALDVADTETTRLAHWVLPGTHSWERADVHLHDAGILPRRMAQVTPALVPPVGQARPEEQVLADLLAAVGPSLRSDFGAALRLRAGRLARGSLDPWIASRLGQRGVPTLEELRAAPHGWDGGDVDRATWRLPGARGRIDLLPDAIAELLGQLREPSGGPGYDHWLLTGAARDAAVRPWDRGPEPVDPGVTLHPSCGLAEGSRARISTRAGSVYATVHLDEGLRPDTVDLPAGYEVDVGALIPGDQLDAETGTAPWNGLPCRVEAG